MASWPTCVMVSAKGPCSSCSVVIEHGVSLASRSPTACSMLWKRSTSSLNEGSGSGFAGYVPPWKWVRTYPISDVMCRMSSEEHTSELQAPDHRVCLLPREKKSNHDTAYTVATMTET